MGEHSQPLDLGEALQRIRQDLNPVSTSEEVATSLASGRILASAVTAPLNLPPFPASAMDGYALHIDRDHVDSADKYEIVGESLAGHPWPGTLTPGQCARVFTGAVVPEGANQVIPQEEVAQRKGNTVFFQTHQPSEKFIRPVGHDIAQGAELLPAGTHLSPFAVGTLISAGVQRIRVVRKLRVGVFSTGDELVDLQVSPESLAPGQIYDSNRATVLNLLAQEPCELIDLGRIPDEHAATEAALTTGAEQCDFLITSGGVSVGDADFVTRSIDALGHLEFWKLNLKPGKPLALGRIGACVLLGLPGNPVSTIVTLLLVAIPAIRHVAGDTSRGATIRAQAELTTQLMHASGRAEFQRGTATLREGRLYVASTGDQASNRMSSFTHSNCLIHIPKEVDNLSAGTMVEILPFYGLLS